MHVTNIGEILKFFIYMIGIDNEGNHNDMICSYIPDKMLHKQTSRNVKVLKIRYHFIPHEG